MLTSVEIYNPADLDASGNLPEGAAGGKYGWARHDVFDNTGVVWQVFESLQSPFDTQRKIATADYFKSHDFMGPNWFPFDAFGSDANNAFDGSIFADNIYGGGGNDRIWGNRGDDHLFGGEGNDVLNGGFGMNELDGGAGNDLIVGGSLAVVRVAPGTGTGPRGEWAVVANVDTIRDGAGNDIVYARGGDDVMIAGTGDDKYYGGSGFDTLDYSGSAAAIRVGLSSNVIDGLGHDAVKNVERVIGTLRNDSFDGNKAANAFEGGWGCDYFRGRGGADTFTGGLGCDTYFWAAKDIVSPTTGQHLGVDTIKDFAKGDVLDLHKLFGSGAADAAPLIVLAHHRLGCRQPGAGRGSAPALSMSCSWRMPTSKASQPYSMKAR